jgi:hypothetical protein
MLAFGWCHGSQCLVDPSQPLTHERLDELPVTGLQRHYDPSAVGVVLAALKEAATVELVDQLAGSRRAQREVLGKLTDRQRLVHGDGDKRGQVPPGQALLIQTGLQLLGELTVRRAHLPGEPDDQAGEFFDVRVERLVGGPYLHGFR